MKPFKNILYVAEETSDQASAIARAVSVAENNQARLTVAEVLPADPTANFSDRSTYHRNKLERLIKPFQKRINIQVEILTGMVFLEVIRSVLRDTYDLVIKPAESTGVMKGLFGSVDMHLLRKCPCPLWIMKPPEKPKYTCILAALDCDPLQLVASEQVFNNDILDHASTLALADGASLHLVHAWEAYAETAMMAHGAISTQGIATHVQNQESMHNKELHGLGEALCGRIGADAYNKLAPSFHLLKGSAKRVIAPFAVELQADLVVMGTVARTGISGLIIGNTAEAILNQLTCSVLAVKPPGFQTPVTL